MLKRRHFHIGAVILLSMALAACATTVGTKTGIKDVKFVIGKTDKYQVAEALGFPAAMEKDQETGFEMWGYHEEPELTGLYYAVPTGAATVTTYNWIYASGRSEQFRNAALICVFDENGILTDMHYPKRERR